MTNNNNHHSRNRVLLQQSYPGFEQYLPTSGLVPASQRTNTAHIAGQTRIPPCDVKSDIARDAAPQPASPSAAWPDRRLHPNRDAIPRQGSGTDTAPTHTRPTKCGVEHDIFRGASSRINIQHTNTAAHRQTSGHPPGRGVHQHPDSPHKSFTHGQRPEEGVRQDKGFLTKALSASQEPAPLEKGQGAHFVNKDSPRSQNAPFSTPPRAGRVKLVHTTIWLHPAVRAELERFAARENLSLSQVGAAACEEWVRQTIHKQFASLLQPIMRQIVREELTAFGNRIVFFLMRIAFAAEQARILVTNILSRLLKHLGAPDSTFQNLVDQSSKMAQRNIITKSPQLKSLMQEWEGSQERDQTQPAKEEALHD